MRDSNDNPSFSSTLLDKIYSSMANGGTKDEDLKFYTQKKQQHEKAKNADKTKKQGFVNVSEFVRKSHHEREHELLDLDYHDGVFFSSTSISSDSSSGCFSSSDIESMYATTTTSTKTKSSSSSSSCFVSPWPKPIKTRVSAAAKSDNKTVKTGDKKFNGKPRDPCLTKQPPISPGGRVASFINSLLGNSKKPKSSSSSSSSPSLSSSSILNREKPMSSCSSASSFSRSCLTKNSPSTRREKLRDNGVKRTVRFCPVSVILDQDSRPCGHKCLYKEEQAGSNLASRMRDEEVKFRAMEKAKRVEEMAREFLKEYHHQDQKKNDFISSDSRRNYEDEDYDDDASSCSSSDLFELDHRVLRGLHKYEELPVYETTHVETNRAIANGFIV